MKHQPVRVLHPITRLIVGGAQENTLFTAELLNPELFSIEVITGTQSGSEGSLLEEARNRGIRVYLLPELVREINPPLDIKAYRKLRKFIHQHHYSIVHTHSSKAGVVGRLAAYSEKTLNVVHTVHGWSFHKKMNPLKRFLFIFLEKLVAAQSDAMVFVSENDMRQGRRLKIGNPETYHLIRSAIPIEEFNPDQFSRDEIRAELGIPLDVPVLGNIGRFSEQKDPITWIRTAASVSDINPSCRFLLVGDGPLMSSVRDEARLLGISNKITYTGIRRDIPRLLRAMDIFLITSLWEGLPRVILQAMAMGIPVIATRVSGIEEVVRHGITGYLVEIGCQQDLVHYSVELLRDSELRIQMGLKAQESVEREFSLDRMLAQITTLYLDLLENKTKPDSNWSGL